MNSDTANNAKGPQQPHHELDRDITLFEKCKQLLTKEEEIELGRRVKSGDKSAAEEFVVRNLRLAMGLALKGKATSRVGFADLAQEAFIGLMDAAKKFDPNMGARFSTYATYYILRNLNNVRRDNRGELRAPRYVQDLLTQLRTAEETHGKLPVDSEATRLILGLTRGQQRCMIAAVSALAATKFSTSDDDSDGVFDQTIDPAPWVGERLEAEETSTQLQAAINRLPARQQDIIRRRFFGGETLLAIGDTVGITRERVRQIEEEAIARLRVLLNKDDVISLATKTA